MLVNTDKLIYWFKCSLPVCYWILYKQQKSAERQENSAIVDRAYTSETLLLAFKQKALRNLYSVS